jgi:hypothetical protein
MEPSVNCASAQESFYSKDVFTRSNDRINDTLTGILTKNSINEYFQAQEIHQRMIRWSKKSLHIRCVTQNAFYEKERHREHH